MMMVVVMMNVVMMVMMVMRGSRHWSRGGGRCVLRHGIAGEAEREDRRGGKGLDHGGTFLWLGNPNGSTRLISDRRLNSI
jgi:hypothetical protein